VNGSLVALKHLRGNGGALINIGSVESDYAIPLQGMYSASKHAVKDFTDALRIELQDAGAPVFQSRWSSPGRSAHHCAARQVSPGGRGDPAGAGLRPREGRARHSCTPRRIAGVTSSSAAAVFASVFSKPMPRVTDWLMKHVMWRSQFRDQPKWSHADNLHHAGDDGNVRGEWSDRTLRPSLYTRASLKPAVRYGVMAGAGAVALLLLRRSFRRR
jgi:hypothetical protein